MPYRGTKWHRFVGGGRCRQFEVFSHLLAPAKAWSINATSCRRYVHLETSKTPRSLKPQSTYPSIGPVNQGHNVDTNSLRNTLEAHRDANRASLIVKIAGKGAGRKPIKVPFLSEHPTTSTRYHPIGPNAKHLEVASSRGRKRKVQRSRLDITPTPVRFGGAIFLAQWSPHSGLRHSEKYPWIRFMEPHHNTDTEGGSTANEQLSREIEAFYSYMQSTPEEKHAADQALKDTLSVLKQVAPDANIDVVGSRATGLDVAMSDIDLNISASQSCDAMSSVKPTLRKIATTLRHDGGDKSIFRSVQRRFDAKIPLVVARHAATYLEVQIQSTVDVLLSLQQAVAFVNEYPTLSRLFVLLKHALSMRGLNSGQHSGLSSYPLLIMIVAALKFSEGKLHRRDSGGQLLFFLDMYADIDFGSTAISLSPLEYVVKRHPHNSTVPLARSAAPSPDRVPLQESHFQLNNQDMEARRRFATIKPGAEFLMCLQDPVNLQKDLGRGAYRIREVQDALIHIRHKLLSDLKTWEEGDPTSQKEPLLASAVGGDYRIFEHRRRSLRESTLTLAAAFSGIRDLSSEKTFQQPANPTHGSEIFKRAKASCSFDLMNSPRISIPRQYGPDRRRSELRMPRFFQRLFKFPQMDFDMAVWEMSHLLIAPKKVFKQIYYHKQTKNTWHRPDPSFTYLLCFFLLLTSFAWSLAYTPAFSNVIKLALMFIFVHFLAGSVALSTLAYFLVGRFLGPGIAGLPGRRRQQGLFGPPSGSRGDMLEFGYCFDVSIRAFFPPYVILYIIQFVLLPVIRHDNRASEFFGNLLYLAAATYWTVITFLGYNALHFLHHTQLLLSPMAVWLTIWLVCTITGVNLSDWGVRWLFLGVHKVV